jgi:hypothetical protein
MSGLLLICLLLCTSSNITCDILFIEKYLRFSPYSDGLRAGRPRLESRQRQEIFLFFTVFRLALGPNQPHIQLMPWAVSPGVGRPGRETEHSPPSSAGFKNGGGIPSLPHRYSWRKQNKFHSVQASSEAHSVSHPITTGGFFQGVKRPGCEVGSHLHLMPRSRMMELYLHSVTYLHGMVFN